MVRKSIRPRGRPRAYDPATALAQARDVFWDAGFAGTSLDDLSLAMGMNRPSLYGAFGDKRALYHAIVERYRKFSVAALEKALGSGRSLADGLALVYGSAIDIYLDGTRGPRGCFLIGTTATEAVLDREARAALGRALREIDDVFEQAFRRALGAGEIAGGDACTLAQLAAGVMNTLAIRARAGEKRQTLERIAAAGVALLCGSEAKRRPALRVRRR